MKYGVDRYHLLRLLVEHGVWKATYRRAAVSLVNDRAHLRSRRMLSSAQAAKGGCKVAETAMCSRAKRVRCALFLERHASTELRNSSPSPDLRPSYQMYASAMSNPASGAIAGSIAIAGANVELYLFPGKPGSRVLHQICFPACEFVPLPIVDWHGLRHRGKVVPKIFNQLLQVAQEIADRRLPRKTSSSGDSQSDRILLIDSMTYPKTALQLNFRVIYSNRERALRSTLSDSFSSAEQHRNPDPWPSATKQPCSSASEQRRKAGMIAELTDMRLPAAFALFGAKRSNGFRNSSAKPLRPNRIPEYWLRPAKIAFFGKSVKRSCHAHLGHMGTLRRAASLASRRSARIERKLKVHRETTRVSRPAHYLYFLVPTA